MMDEEALIAQWEALSGGSVPQDPRRQVIIERDVKSPLSNVDLFAMRKALHRGFHDLHRENYGTEFTSWESPLPQLTWSHQSVEKIKSWLELGGFPWEVEAAIRRRSKITGRNEKDETLAD
jgi:hypothetical protein